jgi:phosphoglycerate dehydrogenase-like enzyme
MSEAAQRRLASDVAKALDGRPHLFTSLGADADLAFVSRDVTGLSTKHTVLPDTQRFYDAMLAARSLQWVHAHSAGADRPIYIALRQRGVTITTSSGANAGIVTQTALAGILALARRFPQLMQAQRDKTWSPLIGSKAPRDLAGQTAVIVGWGPIGQGIAALLATIGVRIAAVSSDARNDAPAAQTVAFENIATLLPQADWLVLACPLTDRTRGLIDASALRLLPAGAHLVNVSRGEVIREDALIDALDHGQLAGAYLDVFEHEPLSVDSPLWSMRNVIVTPHSAGHSDGNEKRVSTIFLENLARYAKGRRQR